MTARGLQITCICRNCSAAFVVPEYRVKQGRAKYCSLPCAIAKRGEDQRGNKFGANNALDLKGQRSGKLVGVEPTGRRHNGILWLFACDCGGSIEMAAGAFREKERRGKGRDACYECQPAGRWGAHRADARQRLERRRRRNAEQRKREGEQRAIRRAAEREAKAAAKEATAPPKVTARAYVVDGKPMGNPKNDAELRWLRQMFPGGEVMEVAA